MLRLQILLMNDERITIGIPASAVRERKPAPHLHVAPPAEVKKTFLEQNNQHPRTVMIA